MRWLVEKKQRFVGIEQSWERFLDYLAARQGTDLRGPRHANMAKIEALLQDVRALIDDLEDDRGNDVAVRLESFGQREDVIDAFDQFRQVEMLPSP
jgi:histidine ammonia-lyase